MFQVRAVAASDLEAVVTAAQHLDSVNLPNDRPRLAQMIERSEKAFAGKAEGSKCDLMFVAAEGDNVVGASIIFAQHGSRKAPHIFFDVLEEERYSETLDRHFRHKVLRIGYNYRGLTEIGGLVVLPAYRGHPERIGKLLAYVRFLYIGLHRELFRDEVVSELMPPLEADGTSLLWEALGRNFTGLSYQEADRLSRENKEFIRTLFPQDPIYASLLPEKAQALIGQVGPTTKPVERMLRTVGFTYANRIDPFDGGPHFQAKTDEIGLVKRTKKTVVRQMTGDDGGTDALVAVELPTSPFIRAVRTRVREHADGLDLPPEAAATLEVEAGQAIAYTKTET